MCTINWSTAVAPGGSTPPNELVNPTKRVAEDSGVATNNESANEKPSSRKRSAREIAQLYEQLKSQGSLYPCVFDSHDTIGKVDPLSWHSQ